MSIPLEQWIAWTFTSPSTCWPILESTQADVFMIDTNWATFNLIDQEEALLLSSFKKTKIATKLFNYTKATN